MATEGYLPHTIKVAAAFLVLMTTGCTSSKDMNGKFPIFPVVAPINIFKLDLIPEQRLCTIEGLKNSKEFITMFSERYPEGWHKASYVSLAPSYRIVTGTTEILILKEGIAILTTGGENKKRVSVHDFSLGEAETLVSIACESAGILE